MNPLPRDPSEAEPEIGLAEFHRQEMKWVGARLRHSTILLAFPTIRESAAMYAVRRALPHERPNLLRAAVKINREQAAEYRRLGPSILAQEENSKADDREREADDLQSAMPTFH